MNLYIIDAEGDGLTPNKFYCLSTWSEKFGLQTATTPDQMRSFFKKADIIVGHNIYRWDVPNLERVLGIKIKSKIVDTLALSWVLFPDRLRHGIESWGEDFGIKKPEIKDWVGLSLKEYVHRCEEDVKINRLLWFHIIKKLTALYGSQKKFWEYIDYLMFKMKCAALQEKSGWLLDVKHCEKSLIELIGIRDEKVQTLRQAMPRVPIKVIKTKPKKAERKDGSLSKKGTEWYSLLDAHNASKTTEEIEIITHYEEGNPNSVPQVKSWLFSLGWKPITFDYKKNKETKKTKAIPKVNLKDGKGLCPSVKSLFEKEQSLEELDSLSILNHRIPTLEKFLKLRDDNNRVQARINGLTNTLRFQHSDPCVNLPRVNRPYAEAIRGSLISGSGMVLCGADMSGLEDRLKHHFIFPYDPDYVRRMMRDDYDPHLSLALMAGLLTAEEVDLYQYIDSLKNKKEAITSDQARTYEAIKAIRSIAKNGNYACQYGAYPPRLALTCDISLEKAQELFDGYWALNSGIKKASDAQYIKELVFDSKEEMWLRNPINGFYYSLRSKNDVFSTLVQGTASYAFDVWVENILNEREQLTAQFHDEVVLCIREGAEEKCTQLIRSALDKTNEKLKLNRELDVGIQYGKKYADIH